MKIGTPLTLEVEKNKEIERYRCKIVERQGSFLFVDYPVHEATGRTSIFEKGTEFSASFVSSNNAVYRFDTEIKDKKNLKIPTLVLSYPGKDELERVQRREYVRIESAVDISLHDTEEEIQPFTTITHDVSGGGFSIVLPREQKIPKAKQLEAWMVLPMESGENAYISSLTQSIRIFERSEGRPPLLSMEFVDIAEKDRQVIIRYCFEKQLQARRKGLT
ncbi:flagellar brake protein [Sediminibacillus albus]|uniref:C-di-GMP-binding flagellar brake protein YcgR, contains PilZNR and PilZ domains n=1 Tax=Sediminibacillus albus TaxID=407036 RepID=A0A1G8VM94_9BACI|nr:flagellar brake domain-containing protein [Sediminibacillus albus]SDJ67099.1 c-di-GMP-binding flagellar brake protein YcgR, contains PilZNR and PilZ domains [Sediminibacillus albus]